MKTATPPGHLFTSRRPSARFDATLYPAHFDGAELNSLGREKLRLMLQGADTASDLTVYMDMPAESSLYAQRSRGVRAYLAGQGLAEGRLKLLAGHNPQALASAKDNLDRLSKTENGTVQQTPSAADNSAATPTSPLGNLSPQISPTGR